MNIDNDEMQSQQVQALQQLYRAVPRPQPRHGLIDDIRQGRKTKLQRGKRYQSVFWASAASLLLGLLVLLQYPTPGTNGRTPNTTHLLASVHKPEQVNFLVTAKQAHEQVTFSLQVPPEWELYGYQGKQSLSWHGKLKAGNNLLSIPVVALQPKAGILIMQIKHNGAVKEYKVQVDVKQDKATMDRSLTREYT